MSEIVRRSGDLAAVFTVLDFIGGKHGLTHEPVTLLTTLIWERRDGAWRMSQRQATRVPRSWCQNEQPDPTALEPSYAAAG